MADIRALKPEKPAAVAEVVEILSGMLKRAQDGEIVEMVAAWIDQRGWSETTRTNLDYGDQMIGTLVRLQTEIAQAIEEGREEAEDDSA